MYELSQSRPVPADLSSSTGCAKPARYPFPTMLVGQSFDVPDSDGVRYAALQVAMSKARHRKRTPGRDFKAERVGDAWRVWRIA